MAQDHSPDLTPSKTDISSTETPSAESTLPTSTPASPSPTPTPVPDTGYTESGVPTLDGVREKIENRYGTALGATELAEETAEGRRAEQQYEARQKAAAEKLEEIRAAMHKPE